MSTITQQYNIGWFGDCDNQPCVPYSLLTQECVDNIETIFEVHQDGEGYWTWKRQFVEFGMPELNKFNELSCGSTYIIYLRTDKESVITIPGFNPTDYDSKSSKLLTDQSVSYTHLTLPTNREV